jgi:hypothetical protein
MRILRLLASVPFAALFFTPAPAEAAPVTFLSHLAYQITGPGGTHQVNSSIVQVDLRKQNGKWSLYIAAADTDGAPVKAAGRINPTCQVTSTDREEVVLAYNKVMESLNKIGTEVACIGSVSAPGTNTVDLQQPGHYFSIMFHA